MSETTPRVRISFDLAGRRSQTAEFPQSEASSNAANAVEAIMALTMGQSELDDARLALREANERAEAAERREQQNVDTLVESCDALRARLDALTAALRAISDDPYTGQETMLIADRALEADADNRPAAATFDPATFEATMDCWDPEAGWWPDTNPDELVASVRKIMRERVQAAMAAQREDR